MVMLRLFGELFVLGLFARHELVQRRIEQADRHREAVHGLHRALDVAS